MANDKTRILHHGREKNVGPQPVGGSQAGTPIQGRIYTKKSSGVLRHALFHFTSVSAYQIIGLLPSEKQLSPRIFYLRCQSHY